MSRTSVEKLVRRLELEPLAEDCFLGHAGRGEGRVFGGMLAAQALVAAGRTVVAAQPHSLHLYFVRGGRHGVPVTWSVTRVRDGYSFTLRHVVAEQSGATILTAMASFTTKHGGLAHQDPMPAVPDPDSLEDWEDLRVRALGSDTVRRPDGPLEMRDCDPATAAPRAGRPARRRVWMRPRTPLPTDDPLLHAAALVYGTDRGLLGTAARPARARDGECARCEPRPHGVVPPSDPLRRLGAVRHDQPGRCGGTRALSWGFVHACRGADRVGRAGRADPRAPGQSIRRTMND